MRLPRLHSLIACERAIDHLDESAQLFKQVGQAWNYPLMSGGSDMARSAAMILTRH